MDNFAWILASVLVAYVAAMFAIAWAAQRRIKTAEDFNVAGRRLPLFLAWATILATWFGAGTLLTQADAVRNEGLHKAALDPWGAGVCLLIAGMFFAKPLWEMRLLTLPDFFRRRFGPTAELMAALVMIPSYFGWIAVQFVALADVLHSLFGLDPHLAMFVIAAVSMVYTLMGGMWSVTLTDAVQMVLILAGLVVLALAALARLGAGQHLLGFQRILSESDALLLRPIPTETFTAVAAWLGVFCVGALGNIPAQDLLQRIFSARSGATARNACLIAGGLYLAFGSLPLLLGLASRLILPSAENAVVIQLANELLRPHPIAMILFILALVSAVLSTIDSAILAPASVLSENVVPRIGRKMGSPAALLNGASQAAPTSVRWSVVVITAASLALAYSGRDAYQLLEGAYSLPFVGLFVPLTLGLYLTPRGEAPAVAAMLTGVGLWLAHYAVELWLGRQIGFLGLGMPIAMFSMLAALLTYLAAHRLGRATLIE